MKSSIKVASMNYKYRAAEDTIRKFIVRKAIAVNEISSFEIG